MLRPILAPLFLVPLWACVSAPAAPLPDPLPEVLEWTRAEAPRGGAFLGLEGRPNDSGTLEALSFDPGLRITRVADGSPAAVAGIAVGDVLLTFDGTAVDDPDTLADLLAQASAGSEAALEVQRGDSVFALRVPLRMMDGGAGTSVVAERLWRAEPARSRAGWKSVAGGVALVTSDPKGPFPRAGVPVGSTLTAFEDEPVLSDGTLVRALVAQPPGKRVHVRYRPPGGGEERAASVKLYSPNRRLLELSVPVLAGYRSSADGQMRSGYLLDLWLISLYRYHRDGVEREHRVLRFFVFKSGSGELLEGGR